MLQQIRICITLTLLVAFIGASIQAPVYAQMAIVNQMPWMPKPGVRIALSSDFTPAVLKGITVHPENPFMFDFIIYRGDKVLSNGQKQEEYKKLVKYFLASLAIPDEDQWVNLSPYEKDRIIKNDFGKTLMGRDLLAQDYILKQITASLIYPEESLGKKFWDKVYAKAQQQYGTTNIPVNTFNKVWIIPDDALIYEKGNTAYVLKNHLKVMLEEDYLSLAKHNAVNSGVIPAKAGIHNQNNVHALASQIVKSIILPTLEKEVNEGKNFAMLRQVYSGMLLAAWFKRTLKKSILGQIYADKTKVKGVDQNPKNNEAIYHRYLQAYKKGVFNYIKEDEDKFTNETIPRKYFSGGMFGYGIDGDLAQLGMNPLKIQDSALTSPEIKDMAGQMPRIDLAEVALDKAMAPKDAAMGVKAKKTGIVAGLALAGLVTGVKLGPPAFHSIARRYQQVEAQRALDEKQKLLRQKVADALYAQQPEFRQITDEYNAVLETREKTKAIAAKAEEVESSLESVVASRDDEIAARLVGRTAALMAAETAKSDGETAKKELKELRTLTDNFRNSKVVQEGSQELPGIDPGHGFISLALIPKALDEFGLVPEIWSTWEMILAGDSDATDQLRKFSDVINGLEAMDSKVEAKSEALKKAREQIIDDEMKKNLISGQPSRTMTTADAAMAHLDIKPSTDRGQVAPGGIDLNSANLAMVIKRDGKGVVLPLAQQDLAQLSNIEGLDPVILSIKPASQTPLFSQLQTSP